MAKNKDTRTGNLTGFLDYDNDKVIYINAKDGGEKPYSLSKFLKRYDGLEISLTAVVNADITPLDEE